MDEIEPPLLPWLKTVPEWLKHIPVPTQEEFEDIDRQLGEQERAAEDATARFLASDPSKPGA